MKPLPRWLAVGAVALALAGCSDDDNPAGPGPEEPVAPTIDRFTVTGNLPLDHGETTKLLWKAPNATNAVITPGIGTVAPASDGTFSIRPSQTTTYTLTVSNSVGTDVAEITVEVRYPPGLYVNPTHGDDSNLGTSPPTALKTLGAALTRVGGGTAIYLAGSANPAFGTYPDALIFDSQDVSVYGGRNPDTFFSDPIAITTIKPSSGVPLTVRNTTAKLQFFDLRFDAANGGSEAVRIQNAAAAFDNCTLDARNSSGGAALVMEGSANVDVNACRVYGGRDRPYLESAGVRASSAGQLLITNCFIDAGVGLDHASGIDARGIVHIGFNTIVSQVNATGLNRYAAGIRILDGHPAIGGNILVGQGTGQRVGIAETQGGSATNPSWFERNLFVGVTTPPYLNADGESPTDEAELSEWEHTTGDAGTVADNLWPGNVPTNVLFASLPNRDYHLVHPLPGGAPNPAVNRGEVYLKKLEYGSVTRDFDDERRPTTASQLDLGADEH
ncbi:MAG TPA: hypothetical protein VFR10_03245 [bacterium]|nr:hypothetical protein [bacterium]